MSVFIKSTPEGKKLIFNAIKAKILKHLEELEAKESGELKKTFSELKGLLLKGGKGLPVGTVREWKGKKFIKVGPGKWKPKYESETRGAKLALSALKKKIAQCEDAHEMMQLVLEHRDRFSDKDGNPLPFVQQLSRFIDQTQESAHKKDASAGAGGDDGGEPQDEKNKGQAARLREKFNQITNQYVGKTIKNEASGIEAVFSKESQKEIRSRTQNTKDNGFSLQEHFEVANQVIELFKGARLENRHDDIKNNEKDVKIERFLSKEVVLQSGKKVRACITVKHSLDKNGRIIYSLETMDIKNALEKTRAKGQPVNTGLSNNLTIPQSNKKSSKTAEKIHIKGDQDDLYGEDKTLSGTKRATIADDGSSRKNTNRKKSQKQALIDFIKYLTNIDISKYADDRYSTRRYLTVDWKKIPVNDQNTLRYVAHQYGKFTIAENGGLGMALIYGDDLKKWR
ncbi:hypothetical protein [Treponema pedis]|uniref:LPD3 domain-containing protein n=1 Tax=Treponema pedis TaxID=409322 RepID=UPI003D22B432